ncbi:MAG TPA: metallophosphoesterase, partial [Nocardioides sp.]
MPHATRRSVLSGAAVTGAAALSAAGYTAAPAHAGKPDTVRLTVLGTTDLHGNVFNWDYYKNAEFSNSAGNEIGVAKVKTLIDAVREDRRGEPILTIDAGDTIQGTPLAYYYARIDPITEGAIHPMARAMNLVGYDAAALGNHEFNYGIDTIRKFEEQVNFPMLGANAVDPST